MRNAADRHHDLVRDHRRRGVSLAAGAAKPRSLALGDRRQVWRPAPWPCRATLLPAGLLLLVATLLVLAAAALGLGAWALPGALRGLF